MKKWMCLLLAGVLLLPLTACKKQNAGETGSTESTSQQTTETTQSMQTESTQTTETRLQQVLDNEKPLYAQGQGEMLLKNYLFPQNDDNTDISCGYVITEAGQKMLAIQQLEGTVVLFESNGKVYGNRYGFRGLYDLQINGVYNWTYTDDEGLHYGVNKLAFKDGEFADAALYRVDQKGLDQVKYTLEGKASDQQTVEAYSATLKSTEVTWMKFLPSHSYALTDATDAPGTKLLTITDNSTNKTIQTLRLEGCEWFVSEPIYTDITFDGHADILVPHQRTAGGAYFAGFVWDGMAYVYTPGLENIPNIALDTENKLVLSCRTQSQITSYGMYRFNTEKWVFEIVRSLHWELVDNNVTLVESVFTDGKETEVNRFTTTPTDDKFTNYASDNLWGIESGKWRNWVYTP